MLRRDRQAWSGKEIDKVNTRDRKACEGGDKDGNGELGSGALAQPAQPQLTGPGQPADRPGDSPRGQGRLLP